MNRDNGSSLPPDYARWFLDLLWIQKDNPD